VTTATVSSPLLPCVAIPPLFLDVDLDVGVVVVDDLVVVQQIVSQTSKVLF